MEERNLLLLTSIMASLLVHKGLCQTCYPTWYMYNEECFKYFEENVILSATKEQCASKGAELISSLTPRFTDFLVSHIGEQHESSSYWCNTLRDEVQRSNVLPPAKASTPAALVPTTENHAGKCCYIQHKEVHEGSCDGLRGFICQKDSISPPATCSPDAKKIGTSCFWIIPVLLDRSQAVEVCSTRSGWLANLKSRKKKMYGIGVVALKKKNFWVGARKEGDKVKWGNGEILDFEEDKNYISIKDDGGDCVRLGLSRVSELRTTWITGSCNVTAYALCEGAALVTSPTTTTTTTTTTAVTVPAKQSCPGSLPREKDGICYWETTFETDRYDWDTARQYCRSYGGDLASYKNAVEEEFTIKYARGTAKGIWIGLRREPGSNVFRWTDGSTLTYTNWAAGQPKTVGDSKLCVTHSGDNSTWEVSYCGYRRWFACKIPKASIPVLPVMPTEEPMMECSKGETTSDSKWFFYQGYCYRFYDSRPLSWDSAKIFCQDQGGYLASIHSIEEVNFLIRLAPFFTEYDDYWIGLRARGLHSSYHWDDGTPLDFVNWDEDDVYDDTSNTDTCVSYDYSSGFWKKKHCNLMSHVVCKSQNGSDHVFTTAAPTPSLPGFCPDGWYTFGNKCYSISEARETWSNASRKCVEIGSTLVSIHSKEEQDFLALLVVNVRSDTWIGMYSTIGGRLFHWKDNSSVDYTNWSDYAPSFSKNEEECVHMFYDRVKLGKWKDFRCNMRFSYICQAPKDPMQTKPVHDPFICKRPRGWLKLESSCYKIYNESDDNRTWLQAQSYCLSVGGNLASAKNFGVSLFLRHHLTGQGRVFWIGMRDTKKGNYESLGVSSVGYTNWISGQPRRVSQLHNCVAVNDEGKWMVRDCSESHPFICVYGEVFPTVAPYDPDMTCPNSSHIWSDYGGKFCYFVETETKISWHEAAHTCSQEGGYLASFHSTREMTTILHHLQDSNMPVHIGFAQKEDGGFAWIDGSAVDYVNWSPGEPSDAQEMCVEMLTNVLTWNDIKCSERRGFVCSTAKVPRISHSNSALDDTEKAKDLQDRIAAGGIVGIVVCVLVVLALGGTACYYFCPSTRMRSRRVSEPASP